MKSRVYLGQFWAGGDISICNIDLGHLTASTIRRIMSGRVNTYAISVTISAYFGDTYGDLGHISAEMYEYIYGPGQYRNSVATHDQSWPINGQTMTKFMYDLGDSSANLPVKYKLIRIPFT